MRELVAREEHLFQQPEFIEENRKRLSGMAERGEYWFQQPKFIEEKRKQWVNRSDEYKLELREDKQKWWDDQSDEYTSWSGVRIGSNEHMTYEKNLPGRQKKQLITLLMEQMMMVRISSSLKYLVPMT